VTQPGKPSNPAEPDSPVPPGFVAAAPGALALAIDPEAVERIERIAAEYLDSIASVPAGSPEYTRTIAAIDHLGERDFIATSAMSGRVLDRRFAAMRGLLAARAPLARQLADLRKAAAELDPARIKLGGRSSPRDELEELDRYFERFAHSQPRLEQLLGSLTEGRLALEQDNAAILTEQASLSTEMETLRQYAFLAGRLDDQLAARIEQAAGTDAAARAEALRLDVLPVVRRRHQEILTQLAIVMQGYSALRIVEDNNAEVIRAVASAVTTTTAALRTAVMVAGAAASRRIVLEQLEAARLAAGTMAEQAAALEAGVSGPGGRVAMLRDAWSEVYAALDRVDAQKARVLRTISEADRELTRPKPGAR
jgi:uncharacterized protein YaaN involved in tellurite resistance